MIGRLQGILREKGEGEVLLDVGGVGYEVEVPTSDWLQLPEPGQGVVLHTHLVVREDAHQLFGFLEQRDRTLFRLLIRVNGVGPRLALGLLSSMDGARFVSCVANNDINALVKLPGIGRKTAERLVVEMRDRLKDWEGAPGKAGLPPIPAAAPASSALKDAETALLSLGYKPQEASRAVMQAQDQLEQAGETLATERLIRLALQALGKGAGQAPVRKLVEEN